jgi:hypothetical protein
VALHLQICWMAVRPYLSCELHTTTYMRSTRNGRISRHLRLWTASGRQKLHAPKAVEEDVRPDDIRLTTRASCEGTGHRTFQQRDHRVKKPRVKVMELVQTSQTLVYP